MGLCLLSQAHPWFLSFAGYAVTAGHFSHVSSTDVVGGAPQDEGIGKVRRRVCELAWGQQGKRTAFLRDVSAHVDVDMLLDNGDILNHLSSLGLF